MLRAAAGGHRTLSLGQGAELAWARAPRPLGTLDVLDIFRQKTAPAFEVALRLGSLFAGESGEALADVCRKYSEALGIAYQIRDDLDDLAASGIDDLEALRPTLPLAVAFERSRADDDLRAVLESAWRRRPEAGRDGRLRRALETLKVEDRCRALLEGYKEQAIRALADVENQSFKGLLRRVIGKIFNDLEVKGWCSEFEARNAAGREARADVAG
jgi:geranylgeranyl pyrophosphate synthase